VRRSLSALALLGVMAFAHGARAADADTTAEYPECPAGKPVAPGNANAAHGAFVAGKASFDAGDYATALIYLKDAYRRDCRKVELLLIIARSYELLGTNGSAPLATFSAGARRSSAKREAARALEVYLRRAAADADVATQRSHLTRLNEEIARMDAEDEALAAKRAAATQFASNGPVSPTPTSTQAPAPPAAPTEARGHTAAPWIVASVGAAGLVAGGVLLGVGSSKESDADTKCPSRKACAPDVTSEGNNGAHDKTAGIVLLGAGGAVLVGGLVWHFAEPTGPRDSAAFALDPLLAPGLAGLGAHGRF
jgi:hypothetical protein